MESRSFLRKTVDWFLCQPALGEARSAASQTARQADFFSRAKSAHAAGELLAEMNKPRGQTVRHESTLFLEALYWALSTARHDMERPRMDALWASSPEIVSELGLSPEATALVERALGMERPAVEIPEIPGAEQAALAKALRQAAERAIRVVNRPRRAVQVLSLKSLIRFGLLLAVLLGAVLGVLHGIRKHKAKDLALGKSWTVSSQAFQCHPGENECGGVPTKILFHTKDDASPFFEYDLGERTAFSSVVVTNRQDGYQERAVPLVLEVSDDQKTYRELARQDATFSVWEPAFPKQQARFVRLRVPRRTHLHLESVEIHP